MMLFSIPAIRRVALTAVAGAAMVGAFASQADARVFIGVGVGLPYYYPGYVPGPYYYAPPPVYYAPPPVVYTPPQTYTPAPAAASAPAGQSCYAGPYVCPMDRPVSAGSSCYCLGNGGQRVTGRAS